MFSRAQKADTSDILAFPFVAVHVGGDLPFGDMAKRYGPNLNMGMNFTYKTHKNLLFGFDFNFMFGRNIKDDVLKQLKTDQSFVIDNSGFPADVRISERVLNLHFTFGKVFQIMAPNPNSGLFVNFGTGYMQHKIHFVDAQIQMAAINGDIRHGYDRLTNGFSISQSLGYLYLSDNRLLNFYAAIECYQGFTKSVRKLNYDTGLPDTDRRLDILTGLRFGWILPLYKKVPKEYYYY